MYKTTAAILFSLILLPVNLCCIFWMFREALYLSGFTVKQFLASAPYFSGSGHHTRHKRQRYLVEFFQHNSSDPQASLALLHRFMLSSFLGLAALILAQWAALSPKHAAIVLLCDLILAAVNVWLFLMGRAYRRSHPLGEELAQALAQERSDSHRGRNILVYTLIGAVFFGFLAFFHLSLASASARGKAEVDSETVYRVLEENGYKTEGIPVTYWYLEENNLMYVCAGVSEGSKFEFYSYSNPQSAESVYAAIKEELFPDWNEAQMDDAETVFSDGAKLLSGIRDGVYQFAVIQGKTVVCATSSNSPDQIRDILSELGYLGR